MSVCGDALTALLKAVQSVCTGRCRAPALNGAECQRRGVRHQGSAGRLSKADAEGSAGGWE